MRRRVERNKRKRLPPTGGGGPLDPSLEPVEYELSLRGPDLGFSLVVRGKRRSVGWLLWRVGGVVTTVGTAVAVFLRLRGH
jgi:hypothetical protein